MMLLETLVDSDVWGVSLRSGGSRKRKVSVARAIMLVMTAIQIGAQSITSQFVPNRDNEASIHLSTR